MTLSASVMQAIRQKDDELIQSSRALAESLAESKERQIRNMLEAAEQASCWKAVELLIRYQAARRQLEARWAERLIETLNNLKKTAKELAGEDPLVSERVHLALIARFLGYLARWDKVRFAGKEE